MNKKIILPLFILLVSCSNNSSSIVSQSQSSSSRPIYSSVYSVLDESIDSFTFEESEDSKSYIISKYKGYQPYIRLPERYNNKPVTGMKDGAFTFSGGLIDLYIPDCIINFSPLALTTCSTIKNIYVNDSHSLYTSIDGILYTKNLETLYACPAKKEKVVTISSTKEISANAFNSTRVEEVILNEEIDTIGESAFNGAKYLKKINIPNNVKQIKPYTFSECTSLTNLTLSNNLEIIGESAFYQCHELRNITIPNQVTLIGDSAFESCINLNSLTIGNKVEIIEDSAFAYTQNLSRISFSNSVKHIGKYAFMQNFSLRELTLNEGLISIDEGAFFYTTNLETINIPSTLESIGYQAFTSSSSKINKYNVNENSLHFTSFEDCLYSKDYKKFYYFPADKKIEEYSIKEGVESIEDCAFYNATTLKTIHLPSTLNHIGKICFYTCTALTSLTYPKTIEEFEQIQKDNYKEVDGYITPWYSTYSRNIKEVICSNGIYTIEK